MNLKALTAIAIATATLGTGCAFDHSARKYTDQHFDKTEAAAKVAIDESMNKPEGRRLIKHVNGKWLGRKSIPLVKEEVYPAQFYEDWNFIFPGRVNVATAAERITKVTGIPVFVKPDAHMPLSTFVPRASGSGSATAGATGAAGAAAAPITGGTLDSGSINSMAQSYSTDMELNYKGSLIGFLDNVASRTSVNWEYKNGRIEFYRIATKTFTLKASPGDTETTGKVSKSGAQSGGSGSSGSSSSSSGSSSFGGESSVTNAMKTNIWASVEEAIESVLSPVGKVSINQGTGTITVTDLKANVDTVASIIEKENLTLNRQVRMRVEILNVQLNKEYEAGVDWNLVYSRLDNLLSPDFALSLASPSSLVSQQAGNVGFSIKATGGSGGLNRYNGSSGMLKALNVLGKASIQNTTNATTTNRQPVPVSLTEQVTYIAATTPVASVTGGTGGLPGLTPGTVTTGFVLNLLPTIQDNGSVLINFSVDMSELKRLNTVTSGSGASQQSIQTPEISSMQFLQRANLRPGETLVLAGFERETNKYDRRGLTENSDSATGGSIAGKTRKEAFVIMMTPEIEDN